MGGFRITLALAAVVAFLGGPRAWADFPRGAQPDWAGLASELKTAGVASDPASVVRALSRHPDAGVRWLAAELLGRRGDRVAIPDLAARLASDPDRLVREGSALALVRLGETSYLGDVKKFLATEEDAAHRIYLARQLVGLGDVSGFGSLVDGVRAPDEQLRFLAVEGLMDLVRRGFAGVDGITPESLLVTLGADKSERVRSELVLQVTIAFQSGFDVSPFLPTISSLAEFDTSADVKEQARSLLTSVGEQRR